MGKTLSPLRYPGGKSQLSKRVQHIIESNGWKGLTYVEPFAGGFGVGLYLLKHNIVDSAVLNDLDQHVYHFWMSALYHTDDLISLVNDTPVTLQDRTIQKALYQSPDSTPLQDGFATLYLNRVNYSGVLFAGPIGGNSQNSKYHVDCRFNKENIIKRIRDVGNLRNRIRLFNFDADDLITRELVHENTRCFYNIDPPYVLKGKSLYSVYYSEQQHRTFSNVVNLHLGMVPWIITYDNCELVREIYQGYRIQQYDMFHSAHNRSKGAELVITNLRDNQFEW